MAMSSMLALSIWVTTALVIMPFLLLMTISLKFWGATKFSSGRSLQMKIILLSIGESIASYSSQNNPHSKITSLEY